jgi:large subunit ribosomal protein L24e
MGSNGVLIVLRSTGTLSWCQEVAKRYYECLVCGRKFPEGQGIVITKAGITLHFHSSRCAAKFLKLLLERLDEDVARRVLRELVDELKKSIEEKRRSRAKVI